MKPHLTSRQPRSSGRAFVGSVGKKSHFRGFFHTRAGEHLVVCPVCELLIATRLGGTVITSHKVGTSKANAWPCPGSDLDAPEAE